MKSTYLEVAELEKCVEGIENGLDRQWENQLLKQLSEPTKPI